MLRLGRVGVGQLLRVRVRVRVMVRLGRVGVGQLSGRRDLLGLRWGCVQAQREAYGCLGLVS